MLHNVSPLCLRTCVRRSILIFGLACAACSTPEPAEVNLRELREDLRVGELAGSVAFGDLVEAAPTPFGGIVVHDILAMSVLHFGREGEVLGRIGRAGDGPGEHGSVKGLTVRANGNILVLSYDNRILEYNPSGGLVQETRLSQRVASGNSLYPLPDESLIVRLAPATGTPAFLELGPNLEVRDSIPVDIDLSSVGAEFPHPSVHGESLLQWYDRDGWLFGNTATGILELHRRGKPVARLSPVERPVEFSALEREVWTDHLRFLWERRGRQGRVPSVPSEKPHYRTVVVSRTGEVWAQRRTYTESPDPSVPESMMGLQPTPRFLEPGIFEVFDPDSGYIFSASGPAGLELVAASGDTVWAYQRGDFGEEQILRLVLVDDGN